MFKDFEVDMAKVVIGSLVMFEGDLGVTVETVTRIAPAGVNGVALYTSPRTWHTVNAVTGRRMYQDGFDVVGINGNF